MSSRAGIVRRERAERHVAVARITESRLLKSWATPPASRPDGLHLLGLPELLLEPLPLGDVAQGHADPVLHPDHLKLKPRRLGPAGGEGDLLLQHLAEAATRRHFS